MLMTPADAEQFVRLHRTLMFYVNQRLQIIPDIKDADEFSSLPPAERLKVRDALVEHMALLEDFVRENPAGLPADELETPRQGIDVLRRDYVRTARAKGASEKRVVLIHALRNAALPIVAMIGLDVGIFMGGAVVVESVFGWPGIGQLAWQAIQRLDIPIIMGVTLVAALFILVGNLIADLLAPFIDPRIRLAR